MRRTRWRMRSAATVLTRTRGSTLGHLALGDRFYVGKLNSGRSPRLDTILKVRAWMRMITSNGASVEIARVIADPGVPDSVLNPEPGAMSALAEERPRLAADDPAGGSSDGIEEKILLTPSEAVAFARIQENTVRRACQTRRYALSEAETLSMNTTVLGRGGPRTAWPTYQATSSNFARHIAP